MKTKTFNVIEVDSFGDVAFNLGQIIGARRSNGEAVVFVVSNEDHVLDALKPYVEAPGDDLAAHVGVTGVSDTVRKYVPKRVHLVYYMPAHIKKIEVHVQDHELLILPVAISSVTIRRQVIALDGVTSVTLFVDSENV